jgi:TetR/AcrR family transcriptional repressor of nem operon
MPNANGPIRVCNTPHGARCADSSLVTRNVTNHFTSLRGTSEAEFSECTSLIERNSLVIDLQGAASCALVAGVCRLLALAVMPRKIEKQVALNRALTVFWDHGYRGTSMDMLTERLGVEKPSIYASFGSKHKLYLSALGHYREWLIGSVRYIVSAAPSARAGVDQAVRMMMLRRSAKSRKGCFATNATLEVADHDPLVRQEVRKTFAELVEVFSHALKLAQSAGHVRTDCAPEILAQLLVNAIGGARIMEKTKASNSATEAVVALIIGILDAPAFGRCANNPELVCIDR